jgi:Arylsulfatase A and related enzymes
MRKHAILALSLSNLCFFEAWREVLSPQGFSYLYYWKQYPGYAAFVALVINVVLLAVVFLCGFSLLRRLGASFWTKLGYVLFIVTLLRALNNIRSQFEILSTSHVRMLVGRGGYIAIVTVVFALLSLAIVRFGLGRVARAGTLILLICSPFGLIGLVQATWLVLKYGPPVAHEKTAAPEFPTDTAAKPRVLWLIFDEMDQNVAFDSRPQGFSLPELDRFRTGAFVANNAYPPAGHTSQSIPALLTGQLISRVKPVAPAELSLTIPPSDQANNWSTQSDIFSDARSVGLNTALVGWYHPYCRVLGDRLTHCRWEPGTQRLDSTKLSLKKNLVRQEAELLRLLPFSNTVIAKLSSETKRNYSSEHLADSLALMREAENVIADQRFGLLFIHLSVPHPPYIYNRASRTVAGHPEGVYLDNLALADQEFGHLRQMMEQAGVWDRTTVIVSSDHWWRSDYWRGRIFWSAADEALAGKVDHRVPFMIKLANQKTNVIYSPQFNTVLTRDLIREIMTGKVAEPDQLASWFDLHRTIGESPYQSYEDVD